MAESTPTPTSTPEVHKEPELYWFTVGHENIKHNYQIKQYIDRKSEYILNYLGIDSLPLGFNIHRWFTLQQNLPTTDTNNPTTITFPSNLAGKALLLCQLLKLSGLLKDDDRMTWDNPFQHQQIEKNQPTPYPNISYLSAVTNLWMFLLQSKDDKTENDLNINIGNYITEMEMKNVHNDDYIIGKYIPYVIPRDDEHVHGLMENLLRDLQGSLDSIPDAHTGVEIPWEKAIILHESILLSFNKHINVGNESNHPYAYPVYISNTYLNKINTIINHRQIVPALQQFLPAFKDNKIVTYDDTVKELVLIDINETGSSRHQSIVKSNQNQITRKSYNRKNKTQPTKNKSRSFQRNKKSARSRKIKSHTRASIKRLLKGCGTCSDCLLNKRISARKIQRKKSYYSN